MATADGQAEYRACRMADIGCETADHGAADAVLDKVDPIAMLATDRVRVRRETNIACRKGGTISIPGVLRFIDPDLARYAMVGIDPNFNED